MSDLITRADIAVMLNIDLRYVSETLEKRADFPRPVLALSTRLKRWARDDVQGWLDQQRKKCRR